MIIGILSGGEMRLGKFTITKEAGMTVLREWRAEIRRELKDEYVRYVLETGIAGYRGASGNLGAAVATRDLDSERSEIVTLSWWTDESAIKAFAGEDISRARYYPADDRFLLTRPDYVYHYDTTLYASVNVSRAGGA